MPQKILLISDDEPFARRVASACGEIEAELVRIDHYNERSPDTGPQSADLVLCDYPTFERIRADHSDVCAVLFGRPADSEQMIEAIKQGALDFLVQPIDPPTLSRHLREALRISRDIRVPAVYEQRPADRAVDEIVGQSPAMKEMYKLIGLIAPRDINVLITGESGTGKELVARAILHHSRRKNRPYLAVNCAAIPETLLESELFGHEKGAFTGADHRRVGKFEQCHGGTIFLDEVGDIPLPTQAKLLRVLQDSTFQRLGGTDVIQADVRIIAASHQPLEELIGRKEFRQDLYYRLKVASIHVPPLREREVDAVLLAHYFVNRYNRDFGTTVQTFAPEALPILLRYSWPGNVRELENAIKSALVIARGTVLRPEFLPQRILDGAAEGAAGADVNVPAGSRDGGGINLGEFAEAMTSQAHLHGQLHSRAMAMIEKELIRACLQRTRGRIAPAARMLGISRTTLRRKLDEFGINVTATIEDDK